MPIFSKLQQIAASFKNLASLKNPDHPNGAVDDEMSARETELRITETAKKNRLALLTPRERELCLLLLEGFTLKESAGRLSVKYSTANTHMTGIYRKLGVNSRAELIINYRDVGLGK